MIAAAEVVARIVFVPLPDGAIVRPCFCDCGFARRFVPQPSRQQ